MPLRTLAHNATSRQRHDVPFLRCGNASNCPFDSRAAEKASLVGDATETVKPIQDLLLRLLLSLGPVMECGNLECCFPAGLSVWNKDRIKSLRGDDVQTFKAAIDAMAHGSAKAQQLKTGISTVDRLVASEYTLYALVDDSCKAVLGIIKVGRKHLYLTDPSGAMMQSDPLCVMDFYVHESCQRKGVGLKLFKLALQHEGVRAHHMAYDRPSPKLIAFLKKHFNLFTSTVQHNHFLVFDEYFNDPGHKTENRRGKVLTQSKDRTTVEVRM